MSDCGLISGPASQYTITGLNDIKDFAIDALNNVDDISDAIRDLIEGLEPVDVDIDLNNAGTLSTSFDIDDPNYVTVPEFIEQTLSYNPSLNLPTFNSTVSPPDDFTKEPPELDYGDSPNPLTAEPPTNAPVVGDYPFPDDPDQTIPAVPSLRPIEVPNLPSLSLPEFTAALPDEPQLLTFTTLDWSEEDYSPEVQAEVIAQIEAILGGSTGIPDHIWDMIESRARRQIRAVARKDEQDAVDYWASRGHFLTNGQLRLRVAQAADRDREQVSELVRELVIQDFKIYVERLNNALAQGIALEGQLIGLHNAVQTRALQAAEMVFKTQLDFAKYYLEYYNARMQGYTAKAQVFQTVMQGELARLEETRIKLEQQKLVSELNLQDLEAYKAQITAIVALYGLFEKQVDAVVAKYDADKTRVEAFAEQVNVYESQVEAYKTEWEAYTARINGEVAKLEAFKTEADVFGTRVQAYATGVQADKAVYEAEADTERLKLDWLDGRVKELDTKVRQESARVEASLRTNEVNARIYEASGRIEENRVQSDAQRLDVLSRNADLRMQRQIQETQLKIQEAANKIRAQTDLLNSVLAAHSQVGASALAALNYSAQISDSIQNSTSCSVNYQY